MSLHWTLKRREALRSGDWYDQQRRRSSTDGGRCVRSSAIESGDTGSLGEPTSLPPLCMVVSGGGLLRSLCAAQSPCPSVSLAPSTGVAKPRTRGRPALSALGLEGRCGGGCAHPRGCCATRPSGPSPLGAARPPCTRAHPCRAANEARDANAARSVEARAC
ncbi:hypothetical protein T492DRAFT_489525 [Pavlovales sp. CCMP2436]|nr:hypothetical protein T492DRAFT_489525 [Pavlovales sp. CCMP2436]